MALMPLRLSKRLASTRSAAFRVRLRGWPVELLYVATNEAIAYSAGCSVITDQPFQFAGFAGLGKSF